MQEYKSSAILIILLASHSFPAVLSRQLANRHIHRNGSEKVSGKAVPLSSARWQPADGIQDGRGQATV